MDNSFIALGLMSGTSMDGIDASIIKSDGKENLKILHNKYLSYPADFKKRLNSFILNIHNKKKFRGKFFHLQIFRERAYFSSS